MIKRLLAAAAIVTVMTAAPAAAQQYPPAVNSLTVSNTSPVPGETIDVEGRTFAPGASTTLSLTSEPGVLASATADAAGVIALQVTIPVDTTIGPHVLTATGEAPDGSELTLSVNLNVVPADAAAGGTATDGDSASGALARTGQDSMPLVQIGLILAAIGGIITAIAAKRRKAAALAA
jgi:hypothetical protein